MNESVKDKPGQRHRVLLGPKSDPAAGEKKKIEGLGWHSDLGHCRSRRDHLEGGMDLVGVPFRGVLRLPYREWPQSVSEVHA